MLILWPKNQASKACLHTAVMGPYQKKVVQVPFISAHKQIQKLLVPLYADILTVYCDIYATLCIVFSPGCYLDEWPIRALGLVATCTWTSDWYQICNFLDWHLAKWHIAALSWVITHTGIACYSCTAFFDGSYIASSRSRRTIFFRFKEVFLQSILTHQCPIYHDAQMLDIGQN